MNPWRSILPEAITLDPQYDEPHIAARMAYRAQLPVQFLWGCQQTLEKYLKFILFLERIKAPKIGHDWLPR